MHPMLNMAVKAARNAGNIIMRHVDRLDQAVVFDPSRNELFTASRGSGAQQNDRRIRVSRVTELEYALLGAGFPFRSHQHMDAWIGTLKEFMLSTSGILRPGSASLDLAYVARGRYERLCEIVLSPWDMAAGALIVLEAGGLVTDLAGGQNFLESGNILAGNPKIHAEMLRRLQPHLTEDLRR